MIPRILDLLALLLLPFVLTGIVNRTKSLWSGRRGPPILQSAYDTLRLLRKTSVYSTTVTPLFRIAPWVLLISAVAAALITPLLGSISIASFPFDFVWVAYVWGLGRVAVMLAGLDTGSAFEGMGVAREATFSTLLEPALFLATGALSLNSGTYTLSELLIVRVSANDASFVVWMCALTTLFVVLQVDAARIPVDDPTTHLELTMVHEVMILDHSGPDLAAIQYGSAIKLYVYASMLATMLNPWAGSSSLAGVVANVLLCGLIAVTVGTVESLIARLRLRTVPKYIAVALTSGAVALLATAWRTGSTP